uniref:Uncharacterized protein n=1 Tax=Molossus molossus TaxID=27622 RepID=A0A7J8GQU3_MOLMO|nr:hypothetical protein HJG59_011341 [Molossus molossus]
MQASAVGHRVQGVSFLAVTTSPGVTLDPQSDVFASLSKQHMEVFLGMKVDEAFRIRDSQNGGTCRSADQKEAGATAVEGETIRARMQAARGPRSAVLPERLPHAGLKSPDGPEGPRDQGKSPYFHRGTKKSMALPTPGAPELSLGEWRLSFAIGKFQGAGTK